jgi:hypothetical protein
MIILKQQAFIKKYGKVDATRANKAKAIIVAKRKLLKKNKTGLLVAHIAVKKALGSIQKKKTHLKVAISVRNTMILVAVTGTKVALKVGILKTLPQKKLAKLYMAEYQARIANRATDVITAQEKLLDSKDEFVHKRAKMLIKRNFRIYYRADAINRLVSDPKVTINRARTFIVRESLIITKKTKLRKINRKICMNLKSHTIKHQTIFKHFLKYDPKKAQRAETKFEKWDMKLWRHEIRGQKLKWALQKARRIYKRWRLVMRVAKRLAVGLKVVKIPKKKLIIKKLKIPKVKPSPVSAKHKAQTKKANNAKKNIIKEQNKKMLDLEDAANYAKKGSTEVDRLKKELSNLDLELNRVKSAGESEIIISLLKDKKRVIQDAKIAITKETKLIRTTSVVLTKVVKSITVIQMIIVKQMKIADKFKVIKPSAAKAAKEEITKQKAELIAKKKSESKLRLTISTARKLLIKEKETLRLSVLIVKALKTGNVSLLRGPAMTSTSSVKGAMKAKYQYIINRIKGIIITQLKIIKVEKDQAVIARAKSILKLQRRKLAQAKLHKRIVAKPNALSRVAKFAIQKQSMTIKESQTTIISTVTIIRTIKVTIMKQIKLVKQYKKINSSKFKLAQTRLRIARRKLAKKHASIKKATQKISKAKKIIKHHKKVLKLVDSVKSKISGIKSKALTQNLAKKSKLQIKKANLMIKKQLKIVRTSKSKIEIKVAKQNIRRHKIMVQKAKLTAKLLANKSLIKTQKLTTKSLISEQKTVITKTTTTIVRIDKLIKIVKMKVIKQTKILSKLRSTNSPKVASFKKLLLASKNLLKKHTLSKFLAKKKITLSKRKLRVHQRNLMVINKVSRAVRGITRKPSSTRAIKSRLLKSYNAKARNARLMIKKQKDIIKISQNARQVIHAKKLLTKYQKVVQKSMMTKALIAAPKIVLAKAHLKIRKNVKVIKIARVTIVKIVKTIRITKMIIKKQTMIYDKFKSTDVVKANRAKKLMIAKTALLKRSKPAIKKAKLVIKKAKKIIKKHKKYFSLHKKMKMAVKLIKKGPVNVKVQKKNGCQS